MNAVRKAEQQVIKEQIKQLKIMNCVCFTILHELGWDADKIVERFNDITQVWEEVRNSHKSTFEVLEEETGIELALDGEKSYHEFGQLSFGERTVTIPEYIYSLHRRVRWIAPMILSCALVALHRIDNWTDEQMEEFIQKDREIRSKCGSDPETFAKYMIEKTGYTPRIWEESWENEHYKTYK